jgi:hypothetical protein
MDAMEAKKIVNAQSLATMNKDRLLRAIRCLQLLQRTNAPTSSMAKSAAKALVPLLKEMASLPADAPPLTLTPPEPTP